MIDPHHIEDTSPLGAAAIVATVQAATASLDGRAAKLAAQARAAQADIIAAIAAIPDGSPDALSVRLGLKALGVAESSIKASVRWHRDQAAAHAKAQARAQEAGSSGEGCGSADHPGTSAAPGWEGRLVTQQNGTAASCVANAITILRNHPSWQGVLRWDDFQESITLGPDGEAPWDEDDRPQATEQGDEGRYLTDSNTTALTAWLARHYNVLLNDEQVYKAARVVARGEGRRYNSATDHLSSLQWDGVDRIGGPGSERSWLTTYFGAEDTPFNRFAGRAWLISVPARAYKPGCQADHVLILEGMVGPGNQGGGKTTGLRRLFGDRFSDSPVDMHSKDRFLNLRGILCQSFDELAVLTRAEAENVKNFLSAQFDIFRPPYAAQSIKAQRRCVFAGTINPKNSSGYLRDETGARRFWPVTCGVLHPIDLDRIERDRDQLFAQAVHLFRSGVPWHPSTPEERALCEEAAAERQEEDPWDDAVAAYLKGRRSVTAAELLGQVVGVAKKDQEQRDLNRVGAILARFGWLRTRQQENGVRLRRYTAPPEPTPQQAMATAEAAVARLERELLLALEARNRAALALDAAGLPHPTPAEVAAEVAAYDAEVLAGASGGAVGSGGEAGHGW